MENHAAADAEAAAIVMLNTTNTKLPFCYNITLI